MYVERLKEIRRVQETSEFFQRHEVSTVIYYEVLSLTT